MNDDGTARWDARAQRWARHEEPVPYTAPPPPFPLLPPQWDPSATGTALATVPPGPDGAALPGRPAPAARRRRGRTAAVVVAAVAAVAAVATTVRYAVDDGSPEPRPGASASASDDGEPGDEGDPVSGLDSADYTLTYVDGYTLAVPDGWQRASVHTDLAYADPLGDDQLMVLDLSTGSETPLSVVTKSDSELSDQSGYRRMKLGPVQSGPENPTDDAAELTYRFQQSASDEVRTCIERAFTADDDGVHAVIICAATSDMPFQRRLMTTVLEHFDTSGY
ncbi:hypothetical protein ACH41E_23085 [Streptomyces sp. NPDC020412]|uniref:hypothetical protein n=1 Tax=Streptomyces sp. NPDC020412 TaxID=3365073 RepID=UPI0037963F5D